MYIYYNRPFNKFMRPAEVGLLPSKSIEEFMRKDIVKPLQRKSLYNPIDRPLIKTWALQTNKNCPIEENLPKRQQYKNYYFHQITNEDKEKYNRHFLPTDHLAIRYPDNDPNKKQTFPFLEMKARYNPQSTSKNAWEPERSRLSMTNNSSLSYNIINHEENKYYLRPSAFSTMKKVNYKKLGIGHYADINRPFYHNFNKEFNKAFEENKHIFKAYKGIFSKMYDDAARNGYIYLPFDTKKLRDSSTGHKNF